MSKRMSAIIALVLVFACALSFQVKQSAAIGDPQKPAAGKPAFALLSAESNPAAVVYGAFLDSGHSPEAAGKMATSCLGIDDDESLTTCYVSWVKIVYCQGGIEMAVTKYMNGDCYTGGQNTGIGECVVPLCIDESQVPWMKLTLQNDCWGLPNGCVEVRITPPDWQPCSAVGTIGACNCFEETVPPVDCRDIEFECCDPRGGDCDNLCGPCGL